MSDPDPTHYPMISRSQAELEKSLLGGERKYTRAQVAELVGVPPDRTRALWIAMGFAMSEDPEAVMFTDGDVAAVRSITTLVDSGALAPELEISVTRTLGQTMSRLAEWQVAVMNAQVKQLDDQEFHDSTSAQEALGSLAAGTVPIIQELQNYVWRRHLAATAGRSLRNFTEETDNRILSVGFADMVGYTRLTRQLDITELTELLEDFESTATTIITQGGGWVIKNVGDEVMFAAESPLDAALISLNLQEANLNDPHSPELRVGLAAGSVLVRFGDLYGSVVNIAARLTSSARPGTVLVDEEIAEALSKEPNLYLKSLRPLHVRGFSRLKTYTLRRAKSI
ncbi:MAG: adenylate/guanylate cyclase domain-containing protein [Mycobacteriaceae bacterium]